MADNFDVAFGDLLLNEGKFSDNPADPGGATMYGITERVARRHGYDGDMRDLPLPLAKDIARIEYWTPIRGDALPFELAFQVFDACYNSGSTQAVKWLQKALGVLPVDGIFAGYTAGALAAAPDIDKVVLRFDAHRLKFMAGLSIWPEFGRGWANRIADNLLRAAG